MNLARAGTFFSYLFIPLVAGCVALNTPGDLTFLSASKVNWKDHLELPEQVDNYFDGAASLGDTGKLDKARKENGRPHRPLLRLEFSTAYRLHHFARSNGYSLGETAYFCERPDDYVRLSFGTVFRHGETVGWLGLEPSEDSDPDSANIYYLFLFVSRERRVDSYPIQEAFDLQAKPEDVCFYLKGGSVAGFGYKSNTVVITKETLAAALGKR